MVDIGEPGLRQAHRTALNNRAALESGGQCGCFHCLRTFDASEVTEWVNRGSTALCPFCAIDAVLSSSQTPIDPEFLSRMREFWFEGTVSLDFPASSEHPD